MSKQTIAPIIQIQQTNSLIRTKLDLSVVREEVSRLELQAQFGEGLRSTLILIIAPAGFGKTTLVTSCLASKDRLIHFKKPRH
jgi:ATP/maltotriose-dependent transcriptional regulator MalT